MVRCQRGELFVDHVHHPLLRDLGEQLHVRLLLAARSLLGLGDEIHEQLRLVEEVDGGQLLRIKDSYGAVGEDGVCHEAADDGLHLGREGHLLERILVVGEGEELFLGQCQVLAEHVLDHESDVGRLLEERLPARRWLLGDVPLKQGRHRLLAEAHAIARDGRDGVHAVSSDLGEYGQGEIAEGFRRATRALVKSVEYGEEELLLVRVALKLVQHLDAAPRNLFRVRRAEGGESEEEREQPRVQMDSRAIRCGEARSVERRVVASNAFLGAEGDDLSVPEERGSHKLVRLCKELLEVRVERLREQSLVQSAA
mmetsp:Transcript_18738/g.38069  ORF Transcript_18738/g.38069 Transcript_18738/m.38069 type:complete len:312 (+) Transcript_18738:2506-3441(+)